MMSIKTSLIITVYNRVHLLRKALISLRNQTMLPDEIILSDDGSDEDIPANIRDITASFNIPVKFISQSKKGFRLAKCRNNGVLQAEGDLLIFLDQDLLHTKDFIKTFIDKNRKGTFITSYPIRLTEKQSRFITEKKIIAGEYSSVITTKQLNKIKKQYLKDRLSTVLYHLKLENNKPKIRGGACAINREDYFAVNGYDENFNAWGSEDDDIRRRLYKYGVYGINPFYSDYPLHLYHEPFHVDGKREHKEYINLRIKEVAEGDFKCRYGITNPLDGEEPEIRILNG